MYTVTGKQVSEDEVERMIETGESETIFQKAILEQGRGHVSPATPWELCSGPCIFWPNTHACQFSVASHARHIAGIAGISLK